MGLNSLNTRILPRNLSVPPRLHSSLTHAGRSGTLLTGREPRLLKNSMHWEFSPSSNSRHQLLQRDLYTSIQQRSRRKFAANLFSKKICSKSSSKGFLHARRKGKYELSSPTSKWISLWETYFKEHFQHATRKVSQVYHKDTVLLEDSSRESLFQRIYALSKYWYIWELKRNSYPVSVLRIVKPFQ